MSEPEATKTGRTGRNLPVAMAVSVVLGGLALVTLFTLKATFLALVAIAVGVALWELARAFGSRGIVVSLVPVAAGGVAMLALAYWSGERPA
ncbi:MAG: phosphatidate cytidylyltransferase, partial [Actinomycetota bacterium]